MQHVKFAALVVASCLMVATTASAEPATGTTTGKKHKQCEGSKVKTSCNQQLDVKEFVQGLQAQPPTPGPAAGADQTANVRKQVQPAKDDSDQPQSPQQPELDSLG
jgi:hypothetical protein